MIDATGALQAEVTISYKCLLFELIVLKLRDNLAILNVFTEEKMNN
jgi:hypothetical protein